MTQTRSKNSISNSCWLRTICFLVAWFVGSTRTSSQLLGLMVGTSIKPLRIGCVLEHCSKTFQIWTKTLHNTVSNFSPKMFTTLPNCIPCNLQMQQSHVFRIGCPIILRILCNEL
uniref:25.7 kDa protein n=1 Tax=Rhizophora mucronata TaxID=61149 RepID=A0A2P2JLR0_RHIMU